MRNPESVPQAKHPESWLKPTNSSSFVWHFASCIDMAAGRTGAARGRRRGQGRDANRKRGERRRRSNTQTKRRTISVRLSLVDECRARKATAATPNEEGGEGEWEGRGRIAARNKHTRHVQSAFHPTHRLPTASALPLSPPRRSSSSSKAHSSSPPLSSPLLSSRAAVLPSFPRVRPSVQSD